MSKRVMILNASPDLEGTISKMIKGFSMAAQVSGFTVDEFILPYMKPQMPVELSIEFEASPIILMASESLTPDLISTVESLDWADHPNKLTILFGSRSDRLLDFFKSYGRSLGCIYIEDNNALEASCALGSQAKHLIEGNN